MSVHVDPDVNLGMSNRGDHKPADEENSKKLADRRLAEYAVKLAEDMYQALNGPYTTYKTARPFFEQRLRSLKEELSPTVWGKSDSATAVGLTSICCNNTEVAWVAPAISAQGYAWFARSDGKARGEPLDARFEGRGVKETKARAMQAAIDWYKEKTWGRSASARGPV